MNRECSGKKFSWNGKVYHRCLYDGSILLESQVKNGICPACERKISQTAEIGVVVGIKTLTYLEVNIPGIGLVEIPTKNDGSVDLKKHQLLS